MAAFRERRQDVERLSRRVDVLTQSRSGEGEGDAFDGVGEGVEKLEERVASLRAGSGDGVNAEGVAEAPAVRRLDERLSRVEDDLFDLEGYVYEWTENAESYLLALRRVAEEKLGVSMDSYIGTVEADGEEGEAGAGAE